MKLYRTIILSLAFATFCACVEEPELNVNPQDSSDVQFGLSLGNGIDTRTVYGEEANNSFPIYWVNGDKVLIASPQCLEGRNSAEFEVACSTATQNYADALTKTGDAGVQWGDTTPADFYSIYPSVGSSLVVSNNEIVANLQVASTQYAETSASTGGFYAQPKDMGNVMMYAYTPGVERGKTVNLRYKPFSTVIEFTIKAPTEQVAGQIQEITVQSLTLAAPTGTSIAGSFEFKFPAQNTDGEPSVKNISNGSNAITLHFVEDNQYQTVLTPSNPTLKAKMCVMPISGISSMKDWTISVTTSVGTFTKKIVDGAGINTALTPGKVHKMTLPTLKYKDGEWNYGTEDWITSLPDYRNIYVTEISLPGAWYAGTPTDQNYQATDDIQTLWDAGVRAFAVETKTMSGESSGQVNPNGVVISGLGSNNGSFAGGKNSLHGDTEGANGAAYRLYRGLSSGNGTRLRTIITNVANAVNPPEFGVLVISYADGGDGGRRYVDYGAWLQMLYEEFNALDSTVKENIYQGDLSANTTVNDVIGKLIIKVNIDAYIAESGSVTTYKNGNWIQTGDWPWEGYFEQVVDKHYEYEYANNLPALFSYNPFLQQMDNPDFSKPYYSNLYWKTWDDDYRGYTAEFNENSGFTWCFSSANRTQTNPAEGATANSTIPTYAQRQAALGAMMTMSKQIYDASTHNVWFYFNCGGTEATSSSSSNPSPTAFATTMNKWLKEQIDAKNNTTDGSPLGIVMFNQCTGSNTTYYSEDIINGIIEMNSQFYLKHAGDNVTGGTTPTAEIQSLSSSYSAAMAESGSNVISWE